MKHQHTKLQILNLISLSIIATICISSNFVSFTDEWARSAIHGVSLLLGMLSVWVLCLAVKFFFLMGIKAPNLPKSAPIIGFVTQTCFLSIGNIYLGLFIVGLFACAFGVGRRRYKLEKARSTTKANGNENKDPVNVSSCNERATGFGN